MSYRFLCSLRHCISEWFHFRQRADYITIRMTRAPFKLASSPTWVGENRKRNKKRTSSVNEPRSNFQGRIVGSQTGRIRSAAHQCAVAPRKGGKEQRSRIASPKGQLNGVAQLLSHYGTEVPKMGEIELDRGEEQRKKNGEKRRE